MAAAGVSYTGVVRRIESMLSRSARLLRRCWCARGRWFSAAELQTSHRPPLPETVKRTATLPQSTFRLRYMIWNCGGLHAARFQELKQWLRTQPPDTAIMWLCCRRLGGLKTSSTLLKAGMLCTVHRVLRGGARLGS